MITIDSKVVVKRYLLRKLIFYLLIDVLISQRNSKISQCNFLIESWLVCSTRPFESSFVPSFKCVLEPPF